MNIISHLKLQEIRNLHKDKVLVLCSGTFDLTHAGHALFFEDCRAQGDVLVVVVGDDVSVREVKGNTRPILNQHVRLKMVSALRPVDYCLVGPPPPKKKPLAFMEYVFENLRPDKYVINDDAFDLASREHFAKKYGMELVVLTRSCPEEFEGISTTKIIDKIKLSGGGMNAA